MISYPKQTSGHCLAQEVHYALCQVDAEAGSSEGDGIDSEEVERSPLSPDFSL
ncbi:hypothetical protein [Paenibacillus xylanexedens]|uniref:hypothetical protein n=1 Tax=Paenibacillus xylanexedens TaxID=528191 RepID=UPI0016434A3F|nr:hypothetical protein [Paenibacillus xylanexedens]